MGSGVFRARRRRWQLAAVALAMLVCTGVAQASSKPVPPGPLTPLVASVLKAPQPAHTTDGRRHLVYEIEVVNHPRSETTVEGVEVRGGGESLAAYDASAVPALFNRDPTAPPDPADATVEPKESTIMWFDVSLPRGEEVPKRIFHRLTVSGEEPIVNEFKAASSAVRLRRPVRVGAPLDGSGYIDGNGCCGIGFHTRALLVVGGSYYLSQRFAIDWVQLDANGNTFVGDPLENDSYHVFGDPLFAVSDAKVVSVSDGLPENVPGTPYQGLTPENATRVALGNHVILDLGGGRFALYAHMKTGSVRVEDGERVRRGQRLGRVGNTGNSDEPHLHFHITNANSALQANGVPYAFDSFELEGRVTNPDTIFDHTGPALVGPAPGPAVRQNRLPLYTDVVTFEAG